jgi:hypothetical protein
MIDVVLVVSEFINIIETSNVQMYKLPSVGEYIKTSHFVSYDLSDKSLYKVDRIIYHYFDDMSDIKYVEVVLSVVG